MSHYNMVHKPIHIPKAMTIPDAKTALDKLWTKLQKLLAWDESKVTSKTEVTRRAKLRRRSFCHINGLLPSQELRNGEKSFKNPEEDWY